MMRRFDGIATMRYVTLIAGPLILMARWPPAATPPPIFAGALRRAGAEAVIWRFGMLSGRCGGEIDAGALAGCAVLAKRDVFRDGFADYAAADFAHGDFGH